MKQMLRRITSLLLAMAMVMSFALTAAAADTSVEDTQEPAVEEQETDFNIEAEDLLTEDKSEGETQDEDSSAQTGGDAEADASQNETEKDDEEGDESQPDAENEANVDEQAVSGQGWAVNESGGFTFSYLADGTLTAAKGGMFALPEVSAAISGGKYTFSEGVYEFDANGVLVDGCALEGDVEEPVTVVTEKANDQNELDRVGAAPVTLMVTHTKVDKLERKVNGSVTTIIPAGALASGDRNGVYYFAGKPYTGYFRENEDDLLYTMVDGKDKTPYGNPTYGGFMIARKDVEINGKKVDFTTYLVNNELTTVMEKKCYFNGEPYTGFFRSFDANDPQCLYYVINGAAAKVNNVRFVVQANSGLMLDHYMENYENFSAEEYPDKFDGRWYAAGYRFTGFWVNSSTSAVYMINDGEIVVNKNYGNKAAYTGMVKVMNYDGVEYSKVFASKVVGDLASNKAYNNHYVENGLLLTGVPTVPTTIGDPLELYVYVKGVKQNLANGWYRAPRDEKTEFWKPYTYYYIKGNKAVTGKQKLKAINNRGTKYKDSASYYYTFRDDGTLVTNLFQYQPSIMKGGKFKVFADHTNYTCTILQYNSSTKNYDIACKSFVVAMSISKSATAATGTKYGNYPLAGGHGSWYHYKSPRTGKWCWYSSSIHIWGSGSMFHSANYADFKSSVSEDKKRHSMVAHIYNQIGTNVTQHCVRPQTINVKLLTALYKNGKYGVDHGRKFTKNVRVYLTKSSTSSHLPFGQMTLTNNCDINGYVIQNADVGYGKDRVADPTDPYIKGKANDIIYIAKKKTSKKADCVKIKMTKANSTYGYVEHAAV